ncbi:MAG: hypothetical protein V2J02_19385 [Pseudomonadales bacterium]|jgi:hypothetical protein|nr:hypothetical protein [Pseudomonadales bacterium]
MVNRDLASNISPAHSIAPDADRTATATGAGVDLRGFDSAAAVVHFGAVTDGGWTPKLQESDDDSTYTDVAAADLVGEFVEAVAASDNTVQCVGYRGNARYIRVVVEETTASTTGAEFGAVVVRGDPLQAPAA